MQSVWIGIWSLIEDGGDGLNMKKWDKLQRGAGIAWFSILHDHAKFSHSHAKCDRKVVAAAPREIVTKWFRMTMRNFRTVMRNFHTVMRNAPKERNSNWLVLHFAPSCEITRGSCESASSPDSLMKKHPEDL